MTNKNFKETTTLVGKKKAIEHNTTNLVKLTKEQKLEMNYNRILETLANYDSVTYKNYDKKHKFTVQIENTNNNLLEIFYTTKDKFHICTRVNLSKYNKERAQYHEKWDMFWDIYTNTSAELDNIIEYIFNELEVLA